MDKEFGRHLAWYVAVGGIPFSVVHTNSESSFRFWRQTGLSPVRIEVL
jgi:hypothetical protein